MIDEEWRVSWNGWLNEHRNRMESVGAKIGDE